MLLALGSCLTERNFSLIALGAAEQRAPTSGTRFAAGSLFWRLYFSVAAWAERSKSARNSRETPLSDYGGCPAWRGPAGDVCRVGSTLGGARGVKRERAPRRVISSPCRGSGPRCAGSRPAAKKCLMVAAGGGGYKARKAGRRSYSSI